MNKEYASAHIEYAELPNYVEPKERLDGAMSEYFKELDEYVDRGKEFVDSIDPEIAGKKSPKIDESAQKKKKQNKS